MGPLYRVIGKMPHLRFIIIATNEPSCRLQRQAEDARSEAAGARA
jgi:hypothetical protein